MSEKELSKEESLKLITDMIGQAKRNYSKSGSFYFLLWGWVVMIANLGHYILSTYQLTEHPYIVWLLTFPAAIISAVRGYNEDRRSIVKSHLDSLYGLIWLTMFICIIIMVVFVKDLHLILNPLILTLAGAGTFISGSMLRFRPLILGGVALWIASIVAFNTAINEQYLVAAVGIMAGYLIPGYLLKKAENA
jgi:hypothetical protein